MKIHEICNVFPRMADDELKELADDIKANGQKVPIVTHEGSVIDGRNRLLACEMAGVKPRTIAWDGKGALTDYVISLNATRRHLTPSQKAMVAAELKPFIEAEIKAKESARKSKNDLGKNSQVDTKPRRAREEAASKVDVNPRYVSDAERIKEKSPETAEAVKRGEKSIGEAKKELGLDKPKSNGKPTGQSRVNGQLVDDPPDIARKRARGLIPPEIIPEISEPETTTAVADVAEDIAEREAMTDEALSDDDWLAKLPLSGQLADTPLKIFRADALTYRRLEAARRSYKHHADRAIKAAGNKRGAFIGRIWSFLGIDHPERWVRCATAENGGCGGSGQVLTIGECPACKGRGYRINRG